MLDLIRAQTFLRENCIDAWLIYDFRGNNPVMWQVLGEKKSTTRRSFMLLTAKGATRVLAHPVDKDQFSHFNYPVDFYSNWINMKDKLKELLKGFKRIAMEYSPMGAIPTMSWVDGGTIELIRKLGVEIVSSANLFQVAAASWDETALNSHLRICREVAEIKDMAFDYIRRAVRKGTVLTEYDVQEYIMEEFQKRNLETEDRPIVAINENSGDPHYETTSQTHSPIGVGSWVLLDIWARYPGDQNVFSDITWVGYVGEDVPSEYQKIFEIVKAARNLVIDHLKEAWHKKITIQGCELDFVAREHISKFGYAKNFLHRTGHSLGPGSCLHALGVNLDNLETHDTRNILPGIGFSIEPGIYLQNFGVRLEINVYIDPIKGVTVTTPIQNEIIRLE